MFSKMHITKETDRLPALSGIAGCLSTCQGDYLAGLWRSDLVRGLCWERSNPSCPSVRSSSSLDIPSWSWASIKSPDGKDLPYITYTAAIGLVLDPKVRILDASCAVSEASTLSSVSGGSICIRAPVIELTLHFDGQFTSFGVAHNLRKDLNLKMISVLWKRIREVVRKFVVC